MNDTTTLAPCPFCGDRAVSIVDDLLTFYVQCETCGTSGGPSSYRNGAVSGWNRRAPTLAPTDAEIWREWELILATSNPTAGTAAIKLARTAIAKWGAPAPANFPARITALLHEVKRGPWEDASGEPLQDDAAAALAWIAAPPAQEARMPLTGEQQRCIAEAHSVAACEEYFAARPQIDFTANRRIFEAGFSKGYGITAAQKETP